MLCLQLESGVVSKNVTKFVYDETKEVELTACKGRAWVADRSPDREAGSERSGILKLLKFLALQDLWWDNRYVRCWYYHGEAKEGVNPS